MLRLPLRYPPHRLPIALLVLCAACAIAPTPPPPPPAADAGATKAVPPKKPALAATPSPASPAKTAPPAAPAAPPAKKPAPPAAVAKAEPSAPRAHAPAPAAKSAPPAAAPLDVRTLEQRLKDTPAIGIMTKLSLKNQVDDLLDQFRAYHAGRLQASLAQLRHSYDLLLMKVLSLLQDSDAALAQAIHDSREAIWAILVDRQKFSEYA